MVETINGKLPPALHAAPGSDPNLSTGSAGLLIVAKAASVVEFFDPRSLKRLGEIALPNFPHEVILSPDRKTAYVSIYGNGIVGTNTEPGTRIAVIDLAKQRLDGFIEVTPYLGPHGMMFDRAGNLWATAEMSNTLIVIDPKRGAVVGAVPIGSHRTHWLAVTPDGAKIYAPHRQLNWVSVVDVATRTVVKKIPNFIYECQGIAIAPDGNRIYQASSARPLVSVIDPNTDTVVGEIMVDGLGDFPPQHTRLKLSPDNQTLVVTYNVSRKAALLDTADLGSQRILPLEKGPMGIAFPDQGDTAFVTNHDEGSITLLDLKSKKVVGRFATKMGPETLAFF
jgi:YVTN family beta-propeller protein